MKWESEVVERWGHSLENLGHDSSLTHMSLGGLQFIDTYVTGRATVH